MMLLNITEIVGDDGLYRCAKCGKVTRRIVNIPAFGFEKEFKIMCDCQEAEKAREKELEKFQADMAAIEKLKKLSLIDERLKDASFKNYEATAENEQAYKIIMRYVEKFDEMLKNGQGLIFHGLVGTGKSYTAATVANELVNRKYAVVMTSFVKLIGKMTSFDTDDEEYIARLNRADLLFIDDLGAERCTDAAIEKVYNIVDSRYRARKPMMITTNLSMTQIKYPEDIRYERIYDRIVEMCYPVRMDGKSRRKREAARRYDEMRRLVEG